LLVDWLLLLASHASRGPATIIVFLSLLSQAKPPSRSKAFFDWPFLVVGGS